MSTPRYDWWPYVKGMIRRYPELCRREADLHTTAVTPNYSGAPGGHGGTRGRSETVERLTYDFCFNGSHSNQVKGADNLICSEVCEREGSCKECPIAKAFDRLAAIEDILGDNYDLDYLRELIRADREESRSGPTLKVGDSVWQTDGIDVYELKVKRLICDCGYIAFDAAAVGKRVFKTSSEAETAMAKAKEAAHE